MNIAFLVSVQIIKSVLICIFITKIVNSQKMVLLFSYSCIAHIKIKCLNLSILISYRMLGKTNVTKFKGSFLLTNKDVHLSDYPIQTSMLRLTR